MARERACCAWGGSLVRLDGLDILALALAQLRVGRIATSMLAHQPSREPRRQRPGCDPDAEQEHVVKQPGHDARRVPLQPAQSCLGDLFGCAEGQDHARTACAVFAPDLGRGGTGTETADPHFVAELQHLDVQRFGKGQDVGLWTADGA